MKDVTGYTSALYGSGARRYALGARWFHWLTALLMFTVIPLGWIFAEFKTKPEAKGVFEAPFPGTQPDYASVHKTIGLVIFVLVVARLVYRFTHTPPVLPGHMPAVTRGLAHATHWLLYLVLIMMPVSGYIMSSAGKNPISILGLFDFPKLPIGKDQGKIAFAIHVYTQFAVYALIALHLAGVAWHLFVNRDNALDRMLPRQANAD